MKRDIEILTNSQFDLIVIGGGITGACLAHDAALRGIKTALIEKNDFGGFTSAASSKLLHGGIRYFPSGQFHKTRESARERTIFQLLAPHLTRYIPFLIPTFSGSLMKGAFVLRSGMLLYSALCRGLEGMIADSGKRIPRNTYLSKRQVMKAFPELAGVPRLAGGQILYESHMLSSERMTLAFIATAVANGACAANYIEAIRLIADNGRVVGVEVRDQFSKQAYTIRGSVVANAAGPALPTINATLPELRLTKPTTGFSKGVHLVTRQINPRFALAMATAHKTEGLVTRGGRHFFIIPWRNRSLIGTTNVPFNGDLDSVAVEKKDIVEFINDIDATLPELQLKEADVAYAFAGLYPLTAKKIRKDTYQGTGEYQIVDHEKTNSVGGIISVLGAKYTTARKVAQLAADLVQQKLRLATTACVTDRQPLRCGQIADLKAFTLARQKAYGKLLSTRQITRLVNYYGRDIDALLTLAGESPQMLAPIAAGHDMLMVEIVHAIKAEMALTLADVVFRRTGLGTTGHPGSEALKNCATQLAAERGWDDDRIQAEIQAVEKMYRYE
jgi:glycerol-3-phosphate dehydrogenase